MSPNMARRASLCFLVLSCLPLTAQSILTMSKYLCSNSTYPNTTLSSTSYKESLNRVLKSLANNSRSPLGYYNSTSNGVYGSFLCKGDLSLDECEECVAKNATKTILRICPGSVWAILWFDQCMIRYTNRNFFGIMETEPSLGGFNPENVVEPDQFMSLLKKTMKNLVIKLGAKYNRVERKSATGDTKFTVKDSLHAMAQCMPDISLVACRNCLEVANSKLLTSETGKIGGRVLLPSCFVRFELYGFYENEINGTKKFPTRTVVLSVAASVALMVASLVGCLLIRRNNINRKRHRQESPSVGSGITELHALQFPLSTVDLATNSFSNDNKLGEGGFGPVYKGKLLSGQEIAAKRLSRGSAQGVEEFRNEVELVAKLQHRNLVRLFGFCMEKEETILVYDYVPNGSLDNYLFDSKTSMILDWPRRYKIATGIARGLLYLHEDSRLRIIHRDLKASNILLDADMNPKISDFGMARIFGVDQVEASTNRVVGTYGYMSPEYIMFGQYSAKSDVFSFGVLVLEIISGKKNSSFQPQGFDEGLLGFVWKHWSEGSPLELADEALENSYSANEVIRCIHIGLLCVQDDPDDRPTMETVVLMLNSESISLPLPQRPSFFFPSRKQRQPVQSLNLNRSIERLTYLSVNEEVLHDESGPR